MALYHVHAAVISKGHSHGGAKGFAQYIAREEQDNGTQALRYIQRDGSIKEDLVAKGSGALPSWAQDATHFFQMADRYERGGATRPGTVARTYEIALPRELTPDQRLELAADIRTTFFERYPHAWAIHNPLDADGGEHPHMHLMLSERGPHDGVSRGAEPFFRQAARAGQDPASRGQRKDRSWQGRDRLRDVRSGVATLTNAALERAGIAAAVSHASLRARGEGREAVIYTRVQEKSRIEAERPRLHQDIHPKENVANLAAWQAQKAREQLHDLRREAMIEHVRDRFWLKDQSPARAQERRESTQRRLLREPARTGRPLQGAAVPTHRARTPPARGAAPRRTRAREDPPRDLTRRWEKPLVGNTTSGIYHTPDQANYGDVHPKNQVRFWTEAAAIEAGYRRAMNDQYGPGTGEAMTEQGAGRRPAAQDAAARMRQRLNPARLLAALAQSKALIDAEQTGAALRIALYPTTDRDKDRGMRW